MSSTLSGLTDQSMSGSITTSKAGDAILFSSASDVNVKQSGGGHLNLKATSANKYTFVEDVQFNGGAVSSVTTLGMNGALTGVTSLGMGGGLTGVTTQASSDTLTISKAGNAILFSSASDVNVKQSGGGHLNLKATGANKYTFVEDVQFNVGAVSSVTTLGMNGALTGVTDLGMNGALTGVTTQASSGTLTISKAGNAILFSSASDVNVDQSG